MRKLNIDYVLTTYSPTMFGESASIHQKTITVDEAKAIMGENTQIVATRPSHENLAKRMFGDLRTTRYADMSPEKTAVFIHYRGAPIDDDGIPPEGSTVTLYLIESETYLEPED